MELAIRNGVALIDECDLSLVSAYSWNATATDKARPDAFYAMAHVYSRDSKGPVPVYMHRLITGAPKGKHVDHRDHNGLNNCRSNLRICTGSMNNASRRIQVGKSGFRGVFPTRNGTFLASITSGNRAGARTIRLGVFRDPIDAARAYDAAALDKFGEFATLNFPVR